VLARFQTYDWPGNVRELRNVLERAVILAGEGTVQIAHLPPGFSGVPSPTAGVSAEQGDLHIRIGQTIEQAERALIELTLEHTKNNKTRAAEILGISQKTLFNKLKEYGTQGAGA
jgi:DNA-binding NtrC family response regulator